MTAGKAHLPPLASLAPLQLVAPLLTPTFLSPVASYALVKTRAVSLHITGEVQPMLACVRIGPKESAPCLDTLGALDLEYHVTGIRKKMWRDLVSAHPPATLQAPTYIIQTVLMQVQALPEPPNKEASPAEIWELQQLSLCRIFNIDHINKLPKIGKKNRLSRQIKIDSRYLNRLHA